MPKQMGFGTFAEPAYMSEVSQTSNQSGAAKDSAIE
jgi:hypothetical protein